MKFRRIGFGLGRLTLIVGLLFAEGCSNDSDDPGNDGWVAGVFEEESNFVDLCENPRSGTNPYNDNLPYPDQQGTIITENNWLRSWSNRTYLWYNEILDRNPANYGNTEAYFATLKTTEKTASGTPKDNFHFSINTAEYQQADQTGMEAGYGAEWVLISAVPPRKLLIAYSQKDSPAAISNLTRGAEILEIDGVDFVADNTQSGIDTLNAGLFPSSVGEKHSFKVRDAGSFQSRTITMTSKLVEMKSVLQTSTIETATGKVGYLVFLSFDLFAEKHLTEAFTQLAAEGVSDLVLDLRYNGGGYVVVASQLAYMIAGAAQTTGKTFNLSVYNDKHREVDPFGGDPIEALPFIDETIGLSLEAGQALPSLNLSRVYVLSTPGTCSASELVINSLRGIGVEVILIGGTTCGKPYGFVPWDNCGTTYFTIQFKASNHAGFGDYADGFSPANAVDAVGVNVTGCSVDDDFAHAFGDENEKLLSAALDYRDNTTCPEPTGRALRSFSKPSQTDGLSILDSPRYRRHQLIRKNLLLDFPSAQRRQLVGSQ